MSDFQNVEKYLFSNGENKYSYDFLGCHMYKAEDKYYYVFKLWAPKAICVSLISDFNGWNKDASIMNFERECGIWSFTYVTDHSLDGCRYKYLVRGCDDVERQKADPYAVACETLKNTASIIRDSIKYDWTDEEYLISRNKLNNKNGHYNSKPINIYEMHLGSWKTRDGKTNVNGDAYLNYREIADQLVDYLKDFSFTHVELMPVTEYPYDGSWGYQVGNYYSPTARYGTPEDYKYFVDTLHKNGYGVIMDWVPAHFPKDEHGLYMFDGSRCYEYESDTRFEMKTWGTHCFDVGKPQVQSFLVSNALYWMREYHIDGLRVDAVASMLYLDYDKEPGKWEKNKYGGRENLEAIGFFQKLNYAIFSEFPNALMIAEESTAWPMITKPVSDGGIGFNYKWNMGWANDMYEYVSTDPIYRASIHNKLTFPLMYAFNENYILPISHDEVVHGKKTILDKMFGTYEEKFMQMRTFLTYMYTLPGKKMMFMGQEYAPFREWDYENQLEWFMLDIENHNKMHRFTKDLTKFYNNHPELWEIEDNWDGFQWVDTSSADKNLISYIRKDVDGNELYVILNFSPCAWDYSLKANVEGEYKIIFSTEESCYGGRDTLYGATYEANDDLELDLYVPKYGSLILQRIS